MEKNFDVCVFGGASLDVTFKQNSDGTYPTKPTIISPGGKGANQAVAAARAGAKTTIISIVGDDPAGEQIIKNLSDNNIDTSLVEQIKNIQSDGVKINVSLGGDNFMERLRGAIDSFNVDMIKKMPM